MVLQASVDWPLIFTPQEPQIAARQEQRTASEPSSRSFACSSPSSTDRVGSSSTSNSCQYGPWPSSGTKRRTLRVYCSVSAISSQYVLSIGCHSVIVTSE